MKSRDKFGDLLNSGNFELPDRSVAEQASGWLTAAYKASLIAQGEVVADLTAGLGIDTIEFAKKASCVYAVEKDPSRSAALTANLQNLSIGNVTVINEDCNRWLYETDNNFDTVYIDPARRTTSGKRVLLLQDCSPDILNLLPRLRQVCKRCLLKVSPLFDLKELERLLPQLICIRIIEVKREVKELLLEMDFTISEAEIEPKIECVVLRKDGGHDVIPVITDDESSIKYIADYKIVEVEGYIYEPSPALMKSALFGSLCKKFPELQKFGVNSHLFYSMELYEHFPGRVFKIKSFFTAKDLKRAKGNCYNIISRNHPAKADELQSRYKFGSSEKDYLIATTIGSKKMIVEAEKVLQF